jgi:hypothetical protein
VGNTESCIVDKKERFHGAKPEAGRKKEEKKEL